MSLYVSLSIHIYIYIYTLQISHRQGWAPGARPEAPGVRRGRQNEIGKLQVKCNSIGKVQVGKMR